MSAAFPYFLSPGADQELRPLRRNWGWFVALGILLILIGMAAISSPVVATLATVEIFGVFLLIAAVVEFASAIWAIGYERTRSLLPGIVAHGVENFLATISFAAMYRF